MFIFLSVFCFKTFASVIVSSHLRHWDLIEVEKHFELGANIVEIDIFNDQIHLLNRIAPILSRYYGQKIVLHFKELNSSKIDKVVELLDSLNLFHSQVWFFSGDSEVDKLIGARFEKIYVSRSVKKDVVNCLKSGMADQKIFLRHCINKDIWIRYSMLKDEKSRRKILRLVKKIRDFEIKNQVAPSFVVLDQIDSVKMYCDVIFDFKDFIDGIITENLVNILPVVRGENPCFAKQSIKGKTSLWGIGRRRKETFY